MGQICPLACILLCHLLSMTSGAIIDRPAKIDDADECPVASLDASVAKDYRQYATDLQNSYRKKHGVGPLTLDAQLSDEAQKFADERVLLDDGVSLAQNLVNGYGLLTLQNDGKVLDPSKAVGKAIQFWYSTVSGYNWMAPLTSELTSHLFAQMVWKSSMRVGIGFAATENRSVVVIFYDPPGNEQSEESYKENVLP